MFLVSKIRNFQILWFVIALFTGIFFVFVALKFANIIPSKAIHPQLKQAKRIPMKSDGTKAIIPHINTTNPNLPSFTADDAMAYASKHSLFLMETIETPTVVSAKFMSDRAASELVNSEPDLSPNALVCVVEIHGRFQVNQPPNINNSVAKRMIFDIVYEVYDARTGNFLSMSAPDSSLEH